MKRNTLSEAVQNTVLGMIPELPSRSRIYYRGAIILIFLCSGAALFICFFL